MRVTKKLSGGVIFFFCCKSCKPAYTTYSGKKNYTTIRFFCYAHLQRKKKITRITTYTGIHTQGMCKANTLSYHISRRSLSLTPCVTFTCSAYQRPCGARKYPPGANRSSITALRPKWVGDLREGELQSKISDRAPYDCQMAGKRNQCGENFHPIDTTA